MTTNFYLGNRNWYPTKPSSSCTNVNSNSPRWYTIETLLPFRRLHLASWQEPIRQKVELKQSSRKLRYVSFSRRCGRLKSLEVSLILWRNRAIYIRFSSQKRPASLLNRPLTRTKWKCSCLPWQVRIIWSFVNKDDNGVLYGFGNNRHVRLFNDLNQWCSEHVQFYVSSARVTPCFREKQRISPMKLQTN